MNTIKTNILKFDIGRIDKSELKAMMLAAQRSNSELKSGTETDAAWAIAFTALTEQLQEVRHEHRNVTNILASVTVARKPDGNWFLVAKITEIEGLEEFAAKKE